MTREVGSYGLSLAVWNPSVDAYLLEEQSCKFHPIREQQQEQEQDE